MLPPLRFTGIRQGDPLLWIALAAGPVGWLGMSLVLSPEPDWTWPLHAPWVFLLPVLVYPVLEEIVFRGLIQDALARLMAWRLGPLTVANLITSVLFAAAHLIHQPPVWAALVFFPSLVFGYFRERHDTLGTPILIHVFYNLGAVYLFWG